MNGKHYVGQKALKAEKYKEAAPISKIILWVDDENCYEAGDDSGMVIEKDCPYATQAMANALLAEIGGYVYKPVRADGAKISPLAELGDGITVDGIYAPLAYQNIRFSSGAVADIAAPATNEVLHEYQVVGETNKEFSRQIAQTRSLIAKTSEEILLEVSGVEGQVTSLRVTLEGVTITDSSGSTLIKGSSIDTSTIKANSISADQINLTGAITWGDLSSGVQQDIDDALSKADDAQTTANDVSGTVSGWTYGSTTYIDGSMIKTGTVMASSLLGGEVGLLDQDENEVGHITIGSASSSSSRIEFVSERALYLEAELGDLYLTSPNGYITFDSAGYVTSRNSICPTSSGGANLGSSGFLWGVVYAESGTINTSDQNKKHDIIYDLDTYDSFFDQLKPSSFLFDNGTSGRRHIGFVAQDIEQALADCGLNSMEFAGFVRSPLEDGDYLYGLRYAEFISLNTWQIQKLKARVQDLERSIYGQAGN